MSTIMLNANKKFQRTYNLMNSGYAFQNSLYSSGVNNFNLQAAYNNTKGDAFANPSPSFKDNKPLSNLQKSAKTISRSSNMLTSSHFRSPYTIGEKIGQHKGNTVSLKSDNVILINGKAYTLPQSAVDLNKKGNGIEILRFANRCFENPDYIASAAPVGLKQKKVLRHNSADIVKKPVPTNSSDKIRSFMTGVIKASTIGLALKGEANLPGFGMCKYTLSFAVNAKDINELKDGKINFGDLIQRGGFSLTLNKVIANASTGAIPTERADTNSFSFNPVSGFTKSFGKKDTFKALNASIELGGGVRVGLNGKIGFGVAPKVSIEFPGSKVIINKGLSAVIGWAQRSAVLNTVISPPVAALQLTLAGALTAIQATNPYLALEATLPVTTSLDIKTGKISLSTQRGDMITGTLPELGNSTLDVVGLGNYIRLPGGKAR